MHSTIDLKKLPKRIQEKITINGESGCWIWGGAVNREGYGVMGSIATSKISALSHRDIFFFLTKQEKITDTLNHKCRIRSCVNPDHLEQITRGENARIGDAGKHLSQKTHCPKGHPYSGENLILSTTKAGHQHRECRACSRTAHRNLWRKKNWGNT